MSVSSILVIDDEEQIQRLLRITLTSYDFSVVEATSANDGLEKCAKTNPDLVLLDLGLPDRSGQEVLTALREWYKNPIIIISAQGSEDGIIKALNNGADDYLIKPFRMHDLLQRIKTFLAIAKKDDSQLIQFDNIVVDLQLKLVSKAQQLLELTPTEYFLLHFFILQEGKLLTHKRIIEQMPEESPIKDIQHLRVYIAQLRKKVEDDMNRPKHIITESNIGYRFLSSPTGK